jgi:hypothetical protein
MSFLKLQFRPGINREVTSYADEGGWFDGDKIRFRMGYPESIGGWEKVSLSQFLGTCRALHTWTSLDNTNYIGVGTNLKYYVLRGADFFDITPIRLTTAAGDVTFAATDGSSTITVTDAAHGAFLNDFVTFSGAVSLGGNVTAPILNAEHQITSIIDGNTYTIAVSVTANASDTGNGGASVVGAYQINTGLDTSVLGTGWGAGPWSADGWGSPSTTAIPGAQLRLWSHDNYGEDLVINVRDGGIFYWDESAGLNARAVPLTALVGANSVPTLARDVLVSDRDRHVLAFGCDDEFSPGVEDPLLIRFCAQEDITDWETRADNTAGSLRISTGSEITAAVKTKQQVLVFTDVSLHTVQFVGAPFTFGLNEVSQGVSIAGQNAAVAVNDSVYWMGKNQFYIYNGNVQEIPCTVKEYVFADFNVYQTNKVVAGHNSEYGEIWWFYPSLNSENIDRYVIFNYQQNIWYYGNLSRSAWVSRGVFGYPIAAGTDGYLYYHEFGINDGSQNPPIGINCYVQSNSFDIGEGDKLMSAWRVIPDLTFRTSDGSPLVTFTLKTQDFPGSGFFEEESNNVVRTATVPIERFTTQQYVRLRGRAMAFRAESNQFNTAWRLGASRVDIRPDGRR